MLPKLPISRTPLEDGQLGSFPMMSILEGVHCAIFFTSEPLEAWSLKPLLGFWDFDTFACSPSTVLVFNDVVFVF